MSRLLFVVLCFASLAARVPAQGTSEGGPDPFLPSAQDEFQPILFGDSAPYEYTPSFFPDASFDPPP